VKTSKTKAKSVEDGVIFQDGEYWSFNWNNEKLNFIKEKFAKIALERLKNE
jgi:hypothetical protein